MMNTVKINSRRYFGNKYKLLPFIKETVEKECKEIRSVFDVFSGTGTVASAFIDKTLFVNDMLYSNHLAHIAWFSPDAYDVEKIQRIIHEYNNLENLSEENYMSQNFSDMYFSHGVCVKIGHIRDDIEKLFCQNEINEKERAILITSLLYAMDKIAATCGHYDGYLKNVSYNDNFVLQIPEMFPTLSQDNKCYNMNANKLAKQVISDLVYLDPPYNSRNYGKTYHLLENVACWKKTRTYGIIGKTNDIYKSYYCTKDAPAAFEELILSLKCKYIILSYNNTGNSATNRSNATISEDDIMRSLTNKGEVKVFSVPYKAYQSGRQSNHVNNEERLFVCKVKSELVPESLK